MAVVRTGSVGSIQSTANNSSASVTVPADAEIAVVCVAGYHATANYLTGTITLGGQSMTIGREDDQSTSFEMSAVYYLVNPPTGTQTLAWNWTGTSAATIGVQFYHAYYLGLNTAAPIRSAGGAAEADSSVNTGSLTAQSGDLVVAIGHAANTVNPATNIAWTNATEVSDLSYNYGRSAFAEQAPVGDVTVTATQSGGSGTLYTNISAIALAVAASGNPYYAYAQQ